MGRLPTLDPEQRALCLAARTVLDEPAAAELGGLARAGLDWTRLWDLAHLHEVVPLLAESLTAAGGAAVPGWWRERGARRRHATLRANARLAAQLQSVLAGFDAAGIESLPVKGLVLAEHLYGSLAARPAADLDVLVRPVDLDRARDVLRDLGFRQRAVHPFAALTHEFHDPAWAIGAGPEQVRLELHWALWAGSLFHLPAHELWERARSATLLGRSVCVLSVEDTLLHLALHRTRSALRMRWVCDVAELVRREGGTLDWDALERRAALAGGRSATWIALELADDLLGAGVPPAVLARLRPGRLKRALLDRTCGVSAMFRAAAAGDVRQQPHLTLRLFEQDGFGPIVRSLAAGVVRAARRFLHRRGIRPVRRAA